MSYVRDIGLLFRWKKGGKVGGGRKINIRPGRVKDFLHFEKRSPGLIQAIARSSGSGDSKPARRNIKGFSWMKPVQKKGIILLIIF
jgi:hypothetical protein